MCGGVLGGGVVHPCFVTSEQVHQVVAHGPEEGVGHESGQHHAASDRRHSHGRKHPHSMGLSVHHPQASAARAQLQQKQA